MNATKEMLSAPVFDKTAGIMEALLAGKISNPQLLSGLSEGLVASKIPVKNLAISSGLGALTGETTRRLLPTISKNHPKRAKALSSIVGGIFGGIPGLASSLVASNVPAVAEAKLLDAYKKIGLTTGVGLGTELSMAPIIKQHGAKFLDPQVVGKLGKGFMTSTPKTVAGLAGGSLLTRASLNRLGLGKYIGPKKGGDILLDTGIGLMASGNPILGATTALAAPLKNTKARQYLADVVKELKRGREIEQLYKKSSYTDNSIKLAAPVYLTKPEYILDAPSLEKVGFIGNLAQRVGKGLGSMVNKFTGGRDLIAKGQKQLTQTIEQQGFKPTDFLNKPTSGRIGAPKAPTLGERFRAGFSGVKPEEVSNIGTYKNIGKGTTEAQNTFGTMKSKLAPQVRQDRTQAAQQNLQQQVTDQAAAAAKAQASAGAKQQPIDAAKSYVAQQQPKLQTIEDRLNSPQVLRSYTKPSGKQSPQEVIDRTGYDFSSTVTKGFPAATSAEGKAYYSVFGKSRAPQESLDNLNNLYAREAAGTLTQAEKRTLDYVKQHGNMPAREYSTYQNVGGNLTATGNIPITNLNTSNLAQVHIDRLQSVRGMAPSKQLSSGNTRVTTLDDALEHLEGLPNISQELKDTRQILNQFKTQNKVTRVSKFDRSAIDAQIDATRSRLQAPITENLTSKKQQIQDTIDQTQARLNKDLAEQQAFSTAKQQARKARLDATKGVVERGEELTMLAPRTFETVGSRVTGSGQRNYQELTDSLTRAEQELQQIDDLIRYSGGNAQLQEARAKAVSNLQSQRAELVSGSGSNVSRLTAPIDSKLTAPLDQASIQVVERRVQEVTSEANKFRQRADKVKQRANAATDPTQKTILEQQATALENSATQLEAQVPKFQAELQAQGRGISRQGMEASIAGQGRQDLTNLKVDQLQQITTGQRANAIDSEMAAAQTALKNVAPGDTFAKAQAKATLGALKSEKKYITRAEKALVEKQTGGAFAPASSVKTTAEANKGVADLEAQINTLTSNATRTPLQDKRLQELKTLKQEYAEQSVKVNTNTTELSNSLNGVQTKIEAQKDILNDPKVMSTAADAAKAEIKNLTKDKTLVENRLNELGRIEQEGVLAGQAQARRDFMSAPVQAPGSARELRQTTLNTSAPERVSTEIKGIQNVSNVFLKGTSTAESNFIANNDLLPAGFSEAMSGVFGRQKGGLLPFGRTEARQVMKDSGLGKVLSKSETVAKESIPGFKVGVPTEVDRTAEKLVQNFLTNNKATPQEILTKAETMGPEVRNVVDAALNNPAVTKQKQALMDASSNFTRRMEGKVSVGLAERSDKITTNINKALSSNSKKYKNLSEASRQDASNIVTSINKAGLNGTPEGTAVLSLVDDALKSNNPKEVERAIESMSQLLQGKAVDVSTLGASKDWLGTFGKSLFGEGSRKGTISFSERSIQKLETLGVKSKPAVELDLKKNFTADNLGRIERHFEANSPVVQKLKGLEASDSGPATINKVLKGESRVADFSNKELKALGVTEFSAPQKLQSAYNSVSKNGENSLSKTLDNIDDKIKKLRKTKKNQQNIPQAKQQQIQELKALRNEINTHSSSVQSTIDGFNNQVMAARQKYLGQDVGSTFTVPDEIRDQALRQIQTTGFGGAKGVAAGTAGVGGAAYLGAGSPEAGQYFQAPVQQPMQGTASYLSSPLAAPVLMNKVAKMQAPVKPMKFKPNDYLQPPVMKPEDIPVESPLTSQYLASMMSAPVGA